MVHGVMPDVPIRPASTVVVMRDGAGSSSHACRRGSSPRTTRSNPMRASG